METIIQTSKLTKAYKDVNAVIDNNITIHKGEIYGFLGLNGAGKTTTIRMLLGLVKPSSGKAYLKGNEISNMSKNIWNSVGYLVETPNTYPMLTVRENLEVFRVMRSIKDPKSVDSIIELMDLTSYSNRLSKNLSLGNKQRLGLAKALIHQPEILILDEPSNGLDPAGIHDIRELLMDLAKNKGVTILVSSHILGEISLFTDRIGIIHKGRMINEFNTHQLDQLCHKQLVINTNNNYLASELLRSKGITKTMHQGEQIIIKDKEVLSNTEKISKILVDANFDLKRLNIEEENLESYFLRSIKEKEI